MFCASSAPNRRIKLVLKRLRRASSESRLLSSAARWISIFQSRFSSLAPPLSTQSNQPGPLMTRNRIKLAKLFRFGYPTNIHFRVSLGAVLFSFFLCSSCVHHVSCALRGFQRGKSKPKTLRSFIISTKTKLISMLRL